MTRTGLALVWGVTFWCCAAPAAAEKAPATAEKASATAEKAQARAVAPEAERILRAMGDYLGTAEHVSFHAEITHDDLLETGQKIQLGATYEAAFQRPNRVYTEYAGDVDQRQLWYDGKTVTLYDPTLDVYAEEPGRETIDATVAHLAKELGFTPPLSDLMTRRPDETLLRNVPYGFVVGTTQVGGARCQHLAFVEKTIDWQIWIEDGIHRVPRKLVITYKKLPGAPQFTALLNDGDLATRPPDSLFRAAPQPGASRISFLQAKGGKAK